MTQRGPVAVVVASRDRPDQAARCLAALRRELREDDELVLVDSASEDAVAYANAAAAHSARLVRVDVKGVNRARNAGWVGTSAEVVLFTDDDVEVEPGWADAGPVVDSPGFRIARGAACKTPSSSRSSSVGPSGSTRSGSSPSRSPFPSDRNSGVGITLARMARNAAPARTASTAKKGTARFTSRE